MACFLMPALAAGATAAIQQHMPNHLHPEWLTTMLGGGAAMLAVEHISHGEVVPYPPFLTAMRSPAETVTMLREMLITGGTMTVAIIACWLVMVGLYSLPQLRRGLAIRIGPDRKRRCG